MVALAIIIGILAYLAIGISVVHRIDPDDFEDDPDHYVLLVLTVFGALLLWPVYFFGRVIAGLGKMLKTYLENKRK